jgi:PAS domain S-box-containing protein
MRDQRKTRKQLISELAHLRRQVAELEAIEAECKLAEEALRQSEEMYRLLVQTSPDAITTTDLEGRITYASHRTLELHGFETQQELLGRSAFSFIAPEHRERARTNLRKVLENGMVRNEEYTLLRGDGTCFAGELNAALIRDGHGKPRAFIASTRDITEQKELEQKIEERRLYLEGVLACAPDAIIALDVQHNVTEWNRGAQNLFGYSEEEAVGRNIDQLIAAPDAETLREATGLTQQASAGRTVSPIEAVRYRKDGTQVDVMLAGAPVFIQDELAGVVALYSDITKRRRAERLLQALNRAALAMARAPTPDEVCRVVDAEFRTMDLSFVVFLIDDNQSRLFPKYLSHCKRAIKAAETLAGLETGKFSFAIDAVNLYREVVRERKAVFLGNAEEATRQVLPGPAKRFAKQLVSLLKMKRFIAAPLISQNSIIGVLSVYGDDLNEDDVPAITAFAHQMGAAWYTAGLLQNLERSLSDLKRTQTQFLQAQKMEAMGRLAGGVAHDFNNLLTVVQLSTRLMERHMHSEDPQRKHVGWILETVERATDLTKQLLSFSRQEVIQPCVLDLNRVIHRMSGMLQRIIGEDIELVTAFGDNLWSVHMDPSQVDQVIMNLVVNARDAMPEGGTLNIRTANAALDEEQVTHHLDAEPGEYVRLTVADTGMGMDAGVQSRMFEPFFTTKGGEKGTGLGLSTVFGIVKQNNGSIWVRSEVGQGTTFHIYLPREADVEIRPPEGVLPAIAPGKSRGTETILVVEDATDVRLLTTEILEAHGYRTLSAQDGREAIRVSREHGGPIHLLFTDLVMPHMSGTELAGLLQAARPDMRVLYMSGHADRPLVRQIVLDRTVAFLRKPFTMEEVTKKVRAVLDGQALGQVEVA